MEQPSIYDFLVSEKDPLLQKLEELERGQSVQVKNAYVSLNLVGLYEISTVDIHECFSTLKKCYEYVCSIIDWEKREVK